MITQFKSKNLSVALLLLWIAFMLAGVIIHVTFQLTLAENSIQKVVAWIFGVAMPIALSVFLVASIELSKRGHFVSAGLAFLIFAASFIWGWHGHYSFWSEGVKLSEQNSVASRLQQSQLETLDNRLNALSPAGNAENIDSINAQINAVELALSRCAKGHASLCITPNSEKLNRLYVKKSQAEANAAKTQKYESVLNQKQKLLEGMISESDQSADAKAPEVFKNVARLLGGDISGAKNISAIIYAAFSLLCMVIESGLLSLREILKLSAPYSENVANTFSQPVFTKSETTPAPMYAQADDYQKSKIGFNVDDTSKHKINAKLNDSLNAGINAKLNAKTGHAAVSNVNNVNNVNNPIVKSPFLTQCSHCGKEIPLAKQSARTRFCSNSCRVLSHNAKANSKKITVAQEKLT